MKIGYMMRQLTACMGLLVISATASAGLITTTIDLGSYITTDRNGLSPATDAQWVGGSDFFVRGRRGGESNNNPQLEAQLFFTFDLSAIASYYEFISATLELTQNSKLNGVNSGDLFLATVDSAWDTGSNMPGFNTTSTKNEFKFGTNGPANAGPALNRDFAIDLSTQVGSWLDGSQNNHGLRMRIEDEFAGASFLTTAEQGPRLVIVSQVPTPTPLALLGLGIAILAWRQRNP